MDHKKKLLGLEKTLSGLSGYEGWMIAKCRFCFQERKRDSTSKTAHFEPSEDAQDTYQLQVLKSNAKLAQIRIAGASRKREDSLEVTLIDPGSFSCENRRGKTCVPVRPGQSPAFFTVTEKEIRLYLKAVNDTNPIHQGKDAIVPGFLMVNRMFEMFQIFTAGPFQAEIRFLAPLLVSEGAEFSVKTEEVRKTILLKTPEKTILKAVITETGTDSLYSA